MGNFLNNLQRLWNNKIIRIFIILILVIIIGIIIIVSVLGNKETKLTNNSLVIAAKRYTANTPNSLPINEYDSRDITLNKLVSEGYIKTSSTCNSYVTVVKVNNDYVYTPYTKCGDKNDSKLLINKIKENIVTSGEGLYYYNNEYIFRGENPNNYVSLGDSKWRIIGIDNNNIKLIYSGTYVESESWDEKYNTTTNQKDGINDYINNSGNSNIKNYLDKYILENSDDIFIPSNKAKLVKHKVCIGKIDIDSNDIDVCKETLDDQLVSVINIKDYINASLDPNCNAATSINCQNYNFLNKSGWTISAKSTDNVYVYYIQTQNGIKAAKGYLGKPIRPVIEIRGNSIYLSGDGTRENPYTLK